MNQKNLRRAQRLFMASIGVVGLAGSTYGTDNIFTWIGPGSATGNTSWGLAANWSGGVAPPQTHAAGDNTIMIFGGTLNAGTATQNASGSSTNPADYTIYGLVFNDYSGFGAGTLVVTTT